MRFHEGFRNASLIYERNESELLESESGYKARSIRRVICKEKRD